MKKKILIVIDWYLPGYKAGGPIQSCANLVAHLTEEYDFYVITKDTDYLETTPYSTIKSNEWNTTENGTKVYYISTDNLNSKTIKTLLKETNFDTVYINGMFSFYFTIVPLLHLKYIRNKAVVVASRGMLASSALAIKSTKKQLFISLAKVFGLFNNVTFHATSDAEVNDIKKIFGTTNKIIIAGNLAKKTITLKWNPCTKEQGKIKVINVARIAPEKNLLFALQLLKHVKTTVEFDFYGPLYNEEYYQLCKEAITQLPPNIKATYKGIIESNNVAALLQNYHVMLMPTLGENFGHIILESLISGCPVLISNQTPWKQLEQKQTGFDIALTDTNKFVDAIELFANMNQSEWETWSKSAYETGKNFTENKTLLEDNIKLFK